MTSVHKFELGTEDAPQAIGPYSQGVKVDNPQTIIKVSGALGVHPKTGKLAPGGVGFQTRQALRNVEAILKAGDASLGDVVEVFVFLTNMGDFAEMNRIYRQFFHEPMTLPARTTVGVAALPVEGAVVEIRVEAML